MLERPVDGAHNSHISLRYVVGADELRACICVLVQRFGEFRIR